MQMELIDYLNSLELSSNNNIKIIDCIVTDRQVDYYCYITNQFESSNEWKVYLQAKQVSLEQVIELQKEVSGRFIKISINKVKQQIKAGINWNTFVGNGYRFYKD